MAHVARTSSVVTTGRPSAEPIIVPSQDDRGPAGPLDPEGLSITVTATDAAPTVMPTPLPQVSNPRAPTASPASTANRAPSPGETAMPLQESTLPDSTLPDSTLPDSTLPDSTLPDSTLPDSTLPDPTLQDLTTSPEGSDLLNKAVHLAVGTAWWATGPLRLGGRLAARTAEAVISDARKRSPWLHLRTQGRSGRTLAGTEQLIQAMLRPVITRVVDAALAELDLTELILENVDLDAVAAKLDVEAVIKRVDLDGVVATVDLDAAVARVNLDQIVSRIDIDSIVAGVDIDAVIGRVDIDSIVAGVNIDAVIDRVDVDSIVKRVDLDAAVALVNLDAAVARVDMEQIISRIDVDSIVATVDLEAVVDRLDIAAVVAKVDPDPIVARVNFDAAMAQIDLIGIAQRIVDGIDLPGIIRDSTGSLASEAVHGVRVQGQQADDAVGQLVGRVFRRRAALDGLHPS